MIITLVKADFSANNIGTLSSFAVLTNILNATYDGPTSIEKGSALSATITLHDGYAISAEEITISMGGVYLTDAVSVSDSVVTVTIPAVTGIIVINMAGYEWTFPTKTIWYVETASIAQSSQCTNNSNGWAYMNTDELNAIRGVWINAVRFATTSTSGTVHVGVAKKGDTATYNLRTGSFTKADTSKEIVTVVLDEPLMLEDDEYLVFQPSDVVDHSAAGWNFYFGTAHATASQTFHSRIPTDLADSGRQWASNSTAAIGWDVGYYVETDIEEDTNPSTPGIDESGITWYTANASLNNTTVCAAGNGSNGWSYGASSSGSPSTIVGVPINYVRLVTNSTSGEVKIGVASSYQATEIKNIVTGTFTKTTNNKEIVTVKLNDTITLSDGEFLVIHPYLEKGDTHNYNFYFAPSGGDGYYSRIPHDLGADSATPWRQFANYNIGWDFGYME